MFLNKLRLFEIITVDTSMYHLILCIMHVQRWYCQEVLKVMWFNRIIKLYYTLYIHLRTDFWAHLRFSFLLLLFFQSNNSNHYDMGVVAFAMNFFLYVHSDLKLGWLNKCVSLQYNTQSLMAHTFLNIKILI